jgi:hypothetical protein
MPGLRIAVVAAAAAAALVPLPSSMVERAYSGGLYLAMQPLVTGLSNRAPFAMFDVMVVAVIGAWIGYVVRDARQPGGWRLKAIAIGSRTVAWGAAVYLLFLLMWGFNYRRLRLAEKLPFDSARVTANAARTAAVAAVSRLNALYDPGHAQAGPAIAGIDAVLASAFDRAIGEAGIRRRVAPARPKATIFDWYFRRAGVDGMTDPFFLETLVSRSLLPFEQPFVVAHEWSHLAGVGDEGEANFIGWLACMRGSPTHQYSGWLFLYGELARVAGGQNRAAVAAGLAAGPRADLQAIRDRFARDVNRSMSEAGWRVYDSYLKANRVEAGAASYAEVVRLVLGVRLSDSPLPTLSEDGRHR